MIKKLKLTIPMRIKITLPENIFSINGQKSCHEIWAFRKDHRPVSYTVLLFSPVAYHLSWPNSCKLTSASLSPYNHYSFSRAQKFSRTTQLHRAISPQIHNFLRSPALLRVIENVVPFSSNRCIASSSACPTTMLYLFSRFVVLYGQSRPRGKIAWDRAHPGGKVDSHIWIRRLSRIVRCVPRMSSPEENIFEVLKKFYFHI